LGHERPGRASSKSGHVGFSNRPFGVKRFQTIHHYCVIAPKFAAQAIRKIYDIGWKPTHFLSNISASVKAVMQPAGPEKGIGIITAAYIKEPSDPQWQDTPEYKEWLAWMNKYNTAANVNDAFAVYAQRA
jgi:hypothetical protein